jgi:uncharacterized membrane protein
MGKIITGILVLVGLINFYPLVGVVSNETVSNLYQINVPNNDILVLLRHRAVLFGLLGAFIIYSAFKTELQGWAIAIGSVSMLSFIVVAVIVGDYSAGVRKVIIADAIALVGLFIAAGIRFWFVKS